MLFRKLNENREALQRMNREVEDTVDTDKLEAAVQDALKFEASDCVAKANAEDNMVQTKKARENLIGSIKG